MESKADGPDSVSRAGRLWRAGLLAALLVLFGGFPHWVGVWVGPAGDWRFLPLLAPAYSDHLGSLGVWWVLALLVNVNLFRRRRWDRTTRWLQLAAGAIGALTLLQVVTGPPVLGPRSEWMELHGWSPALQAEAVRLVEALYPLFKIVLVLALGGLVVLSLRRLLALLDLVTPARRLVREGLGDRGVAGTLELFRQDAGRAYEVLDRDHAFGAEPTSSLGRFFHRSKVLFHGIARQLSPSRRLLFVASLILAIPDKTRWAAVVGLLFLLLVELVDRIRVRDELDVARALQRDLLPSTSPPLPGYTLAHSYRTANEVGGDYHDFPCTADGRVALVIGDASGHGMAAALLMAIANATLQAAVDHRPEPEKVLSQLDRALFRTGGRKAFMTLFYGLLEPASGRFDYVCAGHPFPLLRRSCGEIVELGSGSLPLGLSEGLRFTTERVAIEPDDRLLLFSDGLPEALDAPDGEAFGFRRLRELLAPGGTPQEIHDRILEAFDAHVGEQPLADDLTLVVLHRLPR